TRKPEDAPSAARPPARRTRRTQNRQASAARPSAQYTAAAFRTVPQTPGARPSQIISPTNPAMLPRVQSAHKNIPRTCLTWTGIRRQTPFTAQQRQQREQQDAPAEQR